VLTQSQRQGKGKLQIARNLSLVIFDCDGVLIDSEVISARMLIAELAARGVAVDLAYVAKHFLGRSYPVVMAQIRRDFALDLPPEFEDAYRTRLLAAFESDLKAMPGIAEVLDELALPWCVATSSSPLRAAMSLRLTGLAGRVGSRLFTASEVANGKPAPDLFLHAAARMAADPAACLVIEDSLTGLRAARAAGMEAWRFTGGSHMAGPAEQEPPDARPDRHFDRFDRFFGLDQRLAQRPKADPPSASGPVPQRHPRRAGPLS
jgi:HAD superfamily hydrolase (TIGR01509 family)